MAVSRQQAKITASSASATSLGFTYGSSPTAGNLQTVTASGNGAGQMTGPAGLSAAVNNFGSGTGANIFYRVLPSGASTGPYTISQSAAGEIAGCMDEWTGFNGPPVLLRAPAIGTSASAATLSINLGTTGLDAELAIVMVGVGGTTATTPVASGGLTQDTGFLINSFDMAIALTTSATSLTAATISWTNAHACDIGGALFGAASAHPVRQPVAPALRRTAATGSPKAARTPPVTALGERRPLIVRGGVARVPASARFWREGTLFVPAPATPILRPLAVGAGRLPRSTATRVFVHASPHGPVPAVPLTRGAGPLRTVATRVSTGLRTRPLPAANTPYPRAILRPVTPRLVAVPARARASVGTIVPAAPPASSGLPDDGIGWPIPRVNQRGGLGVQITELYPVTTLVTGPEEGTSVPQGEP